MIRDNFSITAVGGLNEVGANCTLYVANNTIICVDFGIRFNDISEEDPFGGSLPYIEYILSFGKPISYMCFTHGHDDHVGGLKYLQVIQKCYPKLFDKNFKLLANNFTAEIIKRKANSKNDIIEVVKEDTWYYFENISIKYVSVNHSVPHACCILIKMGKNLIMHTGDWRIEKTPVLESDHFQHLISSVNLEKGNNRFFLMSESTNACVDRHTHLTEKEVSQNLFHKMENYCKLGKSMFICFFSSNIQRLISILRVTQRLDIKVCFLSSSGKLFLKITRDLNIVGSSLLDNIIDSKDINNYQQSRVIKIVSGSQAETNATIPRILNGSIKGMKFDSNSVLLYSAQAIPCNTEKVTRMKSLLLISGMIIDDCKDLHTSGHAYRDQIRTLYKELKPDFVVPAHGNYTQMYANAEIAHECSLKTIMLLNGKTMDISDDTKITQKDLISDSPHKNNMETFVVDSSIIDRKHRVFREKSHIIKNGSVVVVINYHLRTFSILDIGTIINSKLKDILSSVAESITTSKPKISEAYKMFYEGISKYANKAKISLSDTPLIKLCII